MRLQFLTLTIICSLPLASCDFLLQRQVDVINSIDTVKTTVSGAVQTTQEYGESLTEGISDIQGELLERVETVSEGIEKIQEGKELIDEGLER